MPRKSDARDRMVAATLMLMQRRGVGGFGLLDVIAQAEAPRGSIYHHFPGGKDELVVAAVAAAAHSAEAAILGAGEGGGSPAEVARRIVAIFRYAPERAQWTTGCPVASTTVDGDFQGPAVRAAVGDAFTRWTAATATVLKAAGLPAAKADGMGVALVAAMEGGILMARGMRSAQAYDAAVAPVVGLLEGS